MKSRTIIIASLITLALLASQGMSTVDAKVTGTLRFRAFIDGSDYVCIQNAGGMVWYEHSNYNYPGETPPYTVSSPAATVVNGVNWYPIWDKTAKKSNIYNVNSPHDYPDGVWTALAVTEVANASDTAQNRGPVTITQYPSRSNNYTAKVFLNDNTGSILYPGAAWYEFELSWEAPSVKMSIVNVKRLSLQLTWTLADFTDFARYEVFQSGTDYVLGGLIANITDVATTSLNVSSLAEGTGYYFTVRVVDANGYWENSTQKDVTTVAPLSAVTASSSSIAENSLTVTWTKSNDPLFVRYEIYQSATQGELGAPKGTVTAITTTSLPVTNLSPGTTYYFTVRVVSQEGLIADSTEMSVTTSVPLFQQTWFIGLIAAIVIAIVALILLMKRKQRPV